MFKFEDNYINNSNDCNSTHANVYERMVETYGTLCSHCYLSKLYQLTLIIMYIRKEEKFNTLKHKFLIIRFNTSYIFNYRLFTSCSRHLIIFFDHPSSHLDQPINQLNKIVIDAKRNKEPNPTNDPICY